MRRGFWGAGCGSVHDLYPNAELSNEIQRWTIEHSRLGIPAIFIEEGLHGYSDGTVFPAPINLAATWHPGLARQTAAAIASEMRAVGVNMVLAPVLDVAREPRWGRVEEDFGEDPYLTGQLGLAYVEGAQGESLSSDHSVIAEPKHFVGHGSPESGLNTSPVHIGERELRSIMLKSFEPAIRQGHAMGVMAAYHEIDGIPVASDPELLNSVLREEWGFKGFVLSDLGAIRRLWEDHHTAADARDAIVQAINAGVDMQFYDFSHEEFQNAIISGMQDHTLSPDTRSRSIVGAESQVCSWALRSPLRRHHADCPGEAQQGTSGIVAPVGEGVDDTAEKRWAPVAIVENSEANCGDWAECGHCSVWRLRGREERTAYQHRRRSEATHAERCYSSG